MKSQKGLLLAGLALVTTLEACASTRHGFSGGMRFSEGMGITPAQPQPRVTFLLGYRRRGWQVSTTAEGSFRVFTPLAGALFAVEGFQIGLEGCRMWHLVHICVGPTLGSRSVIVDEGPGSGWHESTSVLHATLNGRAGFHFRIDRRPGEPGGMFAEMGLGGGVTATPTVLIYQDQEVWRQPLGFAQIYFAIRADIYHL